MSVPNWSIVEYLGTDGLARIEQDWRRLYNAMPNPAVWHAFEAIEVYLEHVCPAPESFRCLALSDGETVRAILPLEDRMNRALGVPVRQWWPSMNGAFWLADVIGPEGDARRALLPAMLRFLRQQRGRPALLSLGRMSAGTTLWDGLEDIEAHGCFVHPDGAEFVVRCDRSFDELKASLSSKTRGCLNADGRKFAALPGARFVRTVAPADLAREFEVFLDVEASGWKGAAKSALKFKPRCAAFYRGLTKNMTRDGHCEIHAMYVGECCIAAAFAVFTGRQCATPRAGYDESFSHVRPGLLLAHKTLEWCCADPNVDSVSEVSDAPWLARWRPNQVAVQGSYFALRPFSGRLLVLVMRLRFGLVRRLARRLKALPSGAKTHT